MAAETETETHDAHVLLDQPNLEMGTETSDSQKPKEKAWVRYRVEHRHRTTNELIHQVDTEEFQVEHNASGQLHEPVFELVTTIRTRLVEAVSTGGDQVAAPAMRPPTYHINIYSVAVINAIRSVVKYYPSQDLTGDVLNINWPYPVLAHHYDELAEFGAECAKEGSDLCVKKRNAKEHIDLLLKFLDDHIMVDVRAEQERNKNGFVTFKHTWVPHKPGITIMASIRGETERAAQVVHSVTGGTFTDPPSEWTVNLWSLAYDGRYLGRTCQEIQIERYDGETSTNKEFLIADCDNLERHENKVDDEMIQSQLGYGKKYWELLRKQCQYYKGKSQEFPFNEVDSLVMADMKAYLEAQPWAKPNLMTTSDLRNWTTHCSCHVCKDRQAADEEKITSLFEDYNDISRDDEETELTAHQYLLCQQYIKTFVFGTRRWELLHVRHFQEPSFDEGMINNLVMHEGRKGLLKALSKSFARRNKREEVIPGDLWSADFVKGKGSGLIFLLHGKPGVGKTCTAECIAAFTRRPLMVLTPSDIGTMTNDVEMNLRKHFSTAKSWGAVLLIDEADVFMERRTSTDLQRNGLVAAFLRQLENYDGILFLTTNRIGSFDDAFISRIHVQLYYPEFTDSQRQQVWKTFIDKFAREKGGSMRLNIDAKEYIRGAEMRAVQWNGREIRNGKSFCTAVAVAEYDGEVDEDGKTIVTDSHFRAIVELSVDFKFYLDELHQGNESTRAQRLLERLDTFQGQ
ncbi:hypothetical protein AK830_g11966 [Neonectria ditissima]|uniref:AAA+ ATPase domain-containing protein n=1 Tax=Neonectria ditissima TaxID=78410 RepID=A0A0P7B1N8_9HYPO|nr:hypothetical protein AK830_g11966 [Neonectria ditissima]